MRGRSFTAAEDLPNGEKVALLSHGLWTRRFGSDPGILGRTISLSGDPHVLTLRMSLTGPQYLTSSGVEEVVRGALERVRAVAGVESASAACCVPLERGYDLPSQLWAGRFMRVRSTAAGPG